MAIEKIKLLGAILELKFIYSEKATKYCEISTIDLTVTTLNKSTVEISQNFVAFSEYMNFNNMYENRNLQQKSSILLVPQETFW